MSTTDMPVAPRRNINILRFVSAGLFLVTAIASVFNSSLQMIPDIWNWAMDPENVFPLGSMHLLLVQVLIPVGALGLAISGVLAKTGKIWIFPVIAFFLFTVPLSWIFELLWQVFSGVDVQFNSPTVTYNNGGLDWFILIALLIATVIGVVSRFVNSKPSAIPAVAAPAAPAAPVMAGTTATSSMTANLPLFAVIGSVFVPIAGIVLGHISLAQMRRGQIPSTNRVLAVIALVIGYVSTVLLAILFVLYTLLFVYATQMGLDY